MSDLAPDVMVRRDVRSVVLDLTERHLTAVRDDRIYTQRRRYTCTDVQTVTVTRRSRTARGTFPIALMMRDGSRVVVSDAPGKAPARRTAELIAAAIGVETEVERQD